jgi:hypothetical protein
MEDRVPYKELKIWIWECYWESLRDRGPLHRVNTTWSEEMIIGFVDSEYTESDGVFVSQLEYFMLDVILLVLSSFKENQRNYYLSKVKKFISENDLEDLLSEIPKEEAEELRRDLRIIKVI